MKGFNTFRVLWSTSKKTCTLFFVQNNGKTNDIVLQIPALIQIAEVYPLLTLIQISAILRLILGLYFKQEH